MRQTTGGPESGLGRYDDYSTKHAAEEADNVFRVYARTKHYTKQERLPANEFKGRQKSQPQTMLHSLLLQLVTG